MTKKHEELVEEIARIVDCGPEIWECTDEDCLGCYTAKGHARSGAKRIIALVLSAVRDGRLDEELGVVGRTDEVGAPLLDWLEEMPGEGTLIFLRPLTGKEEE